MKDTQAQLADHKELLSLVTDLAQSPLREGQLSPHGSKCQSSEHKTSSVCVPTSLHAVLSHVTQHVAQHVSRST